MVRVFAAKAEDFFAKLTFVPSSSVLAIELDATD